ncbi:MAG: isopentenyl-diphosphate Delta-isomerase [Woeseiaceae bacterium]|nr:isopentenyl-diphosphate Delta-isomerase [Woeseiaceae bacterium]
MTDDRNRVVSSEAEQLILVDADDNETGYGSKAECHDGHGILHRAFSVFLFDPSGELLLQQRSNSKRLWPGYWSNSCCSHPRRGESMSIATARRLDDELNVATELKYVYKFSYQADFGEAGAENELCHVYLGRLQEMPVANESEIAALRFVSVADLEREFSANPDSFTPWFKMEWETLRGEHAATLARYTG